MDRETAPDESDHDHQPVDVEDAPEGTDPNPASVQAEGPVEDEAAPVIVDPTGYTS